MTADLRLIPPQKVTIVDSIIEQVVGQIRDGKLRPDEKLPSEREMIDMLGVGRSSVREALKGLAAMGVVEIRPGEGTFVKTKPAESFLGQDIEPFSQGLQKKMRQDLNQARHLVEDAILTLACEQITEERGQAIQQALEFYEAHLRDAPPEQGAWPGHDDLHLAIAEATGNPILVQLLKTLLDLVPMTLRTKGFRDESPEQNARRREEECTYHRQICQAVLAGDAAAARDWMARHVEHEERIIAAFYGS
jgi:DNA-binding FadR family transcriptional regulator